MRTDTALKNACHEAALIAMKALMGEEDGPRVSGPIISVASLTILKNCGKC